MLDCSRPRAPEVVNFFRKLVRIHKLSLDIAGGVPVGEGDFDIGAGKQSILFGFTGEETGGTNVKSLLIGFDAVSDAAILSELKLGEVVTALRTSGFGVETVQCKDLGFVEW